MIHIIGIGPGDPDLLTLKAARLLREADSIYVPRSNDSGRSVADAIIAPHAGSGTIRHVTVSMRSDKRGADPAYATLAGEMAREAQRGLRVVYANIGDTLLYSTGQYLGRELSSLGAPYEYVPGIPSFTAAASLAGIPLASDKEGLFITAMPDTTEALAGLTAIAETVVLLKVYTRLPVLADYVRVHKPVTAVLLSRIGLEDERCFDLTAASDTPEGIGYLSIAILRQAQ